MGKEQNITSSAPEPADVIALLGPAQVLSTESASDFGRVLDKLLCCLNAQHILDVMLIRDFAETSWQIQRYSRLRGLSFERRFKESLDFQAQRLNLGEYPGQAAVVAAGVVRHELPEAESCQLGDAPSPWPAAG